MLNPLREPIRYLRDRLQTEKAYLYWVRLFPCRDGRAAVMRHPHDVDAARLEGLTQPAQASGRIQPAKRSTFHSCL